MMQRPRRRQEAPGRILGVDARLEGMAAKPDLVLRFRQDFAGGDPQLPFDEIDAGDHFGDGVLDLQPRVHLHEPEAVGSQPPRRIDDELDRAGAGIVDGPGRLDRGVGHRAAHLPRHAGGGRLLDHLLVAALRRAVALEQMHGIAVIVAEYLDFDVPRLVDIFFDQHVIVAERRLGFAPRARQRFGEIVCKLDPAHALAAAAGPRLDQHGIADLARLGGEQHQFLRFAMIARHDRHAGLLHQPLGGVLQPHGADRRGRRADEHQPCRRHPVDEIGVFGQETVAGMDRFGAGRQSCRDDPVGTQIAFRSGRGADMHCLVGLPDMQRPCIGIGVDRDGAHAHPAGRADDTTGDLAAIGDQDLGEHPVFLQPASITS